MPEQTAATVLTVASTKGGCGKTTVTRAVAGVLVARGLRVAVIDGDPNRSFSRWWHNGGGHQITLRANDDENGLFDLVDELAAEHDVVIIDTAGFGNRLAVFALGAADAAIVPVTPDDAAVAQADETRKLIRSAGRTANREIPTRVVLTAVSPRTTLATHVRTEIVDRLGLVMTTTALTLRVAWGEATVTGDLVVTDKAGEEAAALVDELVAEGLLPAPVPV